MSRLGLSALLLVLAGCQSAVSPREFLGGSMVGVNVLAQASETGFASCVNATAEGSADEAQCVTDKNQRGELLQESATAVGTMSDAVIASDTADLCDSTRTVRESFAALFAGLRLYINSNQLSLIEAMTQDQVQGCDQ